MGLFVLTRRTFGETAGRAASTLYLVDPWESLWVGYILKESLAVPLFLAACVSLAELAARP